MHHLMDILWTILSTYINDLEETVTKQSVNE